MAQGLLLRHNSVHNANLDAHWTTSLLFSLIQELVDCYDVSQDNFDGSGYSHMSPFDTLTKLGRSRRRGKSDSKI